MTTEAKKAEKKEEGKKAEQAAAKEQAVADLLEADDLFEAKWHSAKDEEQVPLWEADWEDENVADDFAARLRAELDKGMKE
ncbi:hypothetical protein TSOC_000741 [Tetrabaena socialis]|uniref:26S proteasome complex subunit SEM1 n=1 Tax=Tetrabaena socialis TaxID=47790 RepID=A0A2J8AII6_9CHLO|nr:hypothetical protein TSOC_000741 [Tetrabaena socialis]|eukprot:PNH12327.1 hypothetical protein TSOC_000741 [Tetrabaena socialis]